MFNDKNIVAIDTLNGTLPFLTDHLKGDRDYLNTTQTKELLGMTSRAIIDLGRLAEVLTENLVTGLLEDLDVH